MEAAGAVTISKDHWVKINVFHILVMVILHLSMKLITVNLMVTLKS